MNLFAPPSIYFAISSSAAAREINSQQWPTEHERSCTVSSLDRSQCCHGQIWSWALNFASSVVAKFNFRRSTRTRTGCLELPRRWRWRLRCQASRRFWRISHRCSPSRNLFVLCLFDCKQALKKSWNYESEIQNHQNILVVSRISDTLPLFYFSLFDLGFLWGFLENNCR
jgi:hypothetical protein